MFGADGSHHILLSRQIINGTGQIIELKATDIVLSDCWVLYYPLLFPSFTNLFIVKNNGVIFAAHRDRYMYMCTSQVAVLFLC